MNFRNCGNFMSAKKLGSANRKSTNYKFAKCHICGKSNKLFKSANLPICDIRYFFADHPPLKNTGRGHRVRCVKFFCYILFGLRSAFFNIPSQLVQPLEPSATLKGFLALSPYALNATNVQPK
jgi:hypothetical protein